MINEESTEPYEVTFNTKPLTPEREQEIFDKVLAHLRAQKQRSFVTENSIDLCLYRGPNNLKCAIGALIPDRLFDPLKNSKSVYEFSENTDLWNHFGVKYCFLKDLQVLHDEPTNWNIGEESKFIGETRAAILATDYKLVYTPPLDAINPS